MQYHWQEKSAKTATTKKLIVQFGFASDPTLSTRHNASTTLATMPTWYYFSRPSNLAFHDLKKTQTRKKSTFIAWTWTTIHPNPYFDELMESDQGIIV